MRSSPAGLESHLGYWLRMLSNEVSASFAQRLEKHGVSVAQWVVLRLLHDRNDCSLTELSAALNIDKGATSRMIERLVKLGLARREDVPSNRREVALSLTKKAAQLVPRLATEADENDRAFFSVLNERQRANFLKTIKLLISTRTNKPARIPLA